MSPPASAARSIDADVLGNVGFHLIDPCLQDIAELFDCHQAEDADQAGNDDVLHNALTGLILQQLFWGGLSLLHGSPFVKPFRWGTGTLARGPEKS